MLLKTIFTLIDIYGVLCVGVWVLRYLYRFSNAIEVKRGKSSLALDALIAVLTAVTALTPAMIIYYYFGSSL
jgi:nitrogen fixation/metabolism regulation signal transduction histidine kinase